MGSALIQLSLLICIFGAEAYQFHEQSWSHTLFLDNGLELRWTNEDPEWVTFEMSAPVKGYMAVGFSPNGAMKGSDIVMGWVDENGVPNIKDLYAIGNQKPIEDPTQDVELISGQEINGKTTIRFRRQWNTCDDKHDMKISEDTVRLIWAVSDVDPTYENGVFKPKYHEKNRGVRRTFMKSKPNSIPFPDEQGGDASVKSWDINMENNEINGVNNAYFCKITKFPKSDRKQHLIGYKPLLQKGNEFSIHHIIMYECLVPPHDGKTEDIFEEFADKPGGHCYTPNMPPTWGQYCTNFPVVWTSGSEGNMFPIEFGQTLGEEHGGTTYFMFEVHYDNPRLETFTDSSGFRIFYTDKLRQFDGGSMTIGHKISPFHVVPPKLESFTSIGFCPAECTAQTIPPTGIQVTNVLLHAHYAGRKVTLRHYRNGVEMPPIAQESHYDYNYQQMRVLDPPLTLLPGDELLTECEYNTTKNEQPAFGGLNTQDEMCLSALNYYPKIELAECRSQPEFYSFLNGIGVNKVEGEILEKMQMPYKPKEGQKVDYYDNPFYLKNSTAETTLNGLDAMTISDESSKYDTVGDLLRQLDWPLNGKTVQDNWVQGKHYVFCTGNGKRRFPLRDYMREKPNFPSVTPSPQLTDKCAFQKSTAAFGGFLPSQGLGYQSYHHNPFGQSGIIMNHRPAQLSQRWNYPGFFYPSHHSGFADSSRVVYLQPQLHTDFNKKREAGEELPLMHNKFPTSEW